MEEAPKGLSREERLAARLRENLKRRKAQARELSSSRRKPGPLAAPNIGGAIDPAVPDQVRDDPALPKPRPKNV